VSIRTTVILVLPFAAGFIWTVRFGWQLGAIALTLFLLAEISFYIALGWLPGFLEWMNDKVYTDPSIRILIWSGIAAVPFFLGTATRWTFGQVIRVDPADRSGN